MADDERKQLVRRLLEDALSGARPGTADEVVAPSFRAHAPAARDIAGAGGLNEYATMLRAGFPDLQITVDEVFGDGDRLAAEFTVRGTQRGKFRGVPATKRRIELPANAFANVTDGQVTELWAEWDQKLLLEQLEVLPVLIRSE
jgi:steroid delta-isomerase-like uncharacterized protein